MYIMTASEDNVPLYKKNTTRVSVCIIALVCNYKIILYVFNIYIYIYIYLYV